MSSNGAIELWGIDLSESQKKAADELLIDLNPHLCRAPMELILAYRNNILTMSTLFMQSAGRQI